MISFLTFSYLVFLLCFSLQYLPLSITGLNLKALWLAENQSKPMLKFQREFDEKLNAEVLTCFLLPQQDYHPESMGMWQNLNDLNFFLFSVDSPESVTQTFNYERCFFVKK